MTGLSSRWIVVLCLCLLSQQFAPAYTLHLSKNSLVKSKRSEEQEEPDQEEEEENQAHHDEQEDSKDTAVQKRGIFSSFLKWKWRSLRKTINAVDKITEVTILATTVIPAIVGCERRGVKGINDLWVKHTQLAAEYDNITKQIDQYILKAYNMREYANYSINMDEEVRVQMDRLVTEQKYAFEYMDPRFKTVITNETYNLEKMIKKKKANGEKVDLLEVVRGYERRLDLALSLALPSLSLAMPYAAKLFKHLRKGVIGRNIQNLEDKFGAFKILSSTSDDTTRLLKGYRSLGAKSTSRGFKGRLTKIIEGMKTKYDRVKKIVNVIKTGFKALVNIGSSALKIWTTIETFKDCNEKKDDAIEAVKKMEHFLEQNRKLLEDAKSTVHNTKEALRDVYNVGWDPNLLEALKMIQNMVEEDEISKPRPQRTEILKSIEDYLKGSLDNYEELFNLQENLKQSLTLITYSTACFTAKGSFKENVNRDCAGGEDTFDKLYSDEVDSYAYPDKIDNCRESSGELYITLDNLKMAWKKAVENNSTVHHVCLMNNKLKVSTIKGDLMDGTTDLSEIAKGIFDDGIKHKGAKEEIEAVIKSLPSLDELPLNDDIIKTICVMKPFISDIAEMIKHLRDHEITKRKLSEKLVEDALNNCA